MKGFGLGSRVTKQRLSDYYAGIEDSREVRERGWGLKLFPAVEKLMERERDRFQRSNPRGSVIGWLWVGGETSHFVHWLF